MLSRSSREGAGVRYRAGARVFVLLVALGASLSAAPKGLTPGPSPSTPDGEGRKAGGTPALPGGDMDAALQRLAEEADRIDPSAPDALVRLRAVVRGLIEVERAHRREVAALRVEFSSRNGMTASRRSAGAAALKGRLPGSTGTASAPNGSSPAVAEAAGSAGLFGKRGLKKVHRAGCGFGERIAAESRVHFKTMAEAEAAGYEACKSCRPGGS